MTFLSDRYPNFHFKASSHTIAATEFRTEDTELREKKKGHKKYIILKRYYRLINIEGKGSNN